MRGEKKCYCHPGLEKSPTEGCEFVVSLLKESTVISFLGWCSSFHPIAVTNIVIKSNLGEERFIWLILPSHSPSLREMGTGTWSRNHGETLFAGSFSDSCLASFHNTAQNCPPGMVLSTTGFALLYQLTIKTISHRLDLVNPSIETPFSDDSSCVKLTGNQTFLKYGSSQIGNKWHP